MRYVDINQPMSEDKWTTVPRAMQMWAIHELEDWNVALRIIEQDGHAIVAGIRLYPAQADEQQELGSWDEASPIAPGGMQPKTINSVKLGNLLPELRREFKTQVSTVDLDQLASAIKHGDPFLVDHPMIDRGFYSLGSAAVNHPRHPRPGSKGWDDEHYLYYAIAYADAAAARVRNPHVRVALAEFGTKDEHEYVSDQVRKARQKDLLTPSEPGRVSGKLTQKAHRLKTSLGHEPTPIHRRVIGADE